MRFASSVKKDLSGVTVAKLNEIEREIKSISADDVDTEFDPVNHPAHYNAHPSGVECIDIIEHWSYNIGAAMKYLWRAGLKPGADHVEDLRKAVWYIEREISRIAAVPDPDDE